VTATDTGGLSASSAFNLNVANVNDTPATNADTGAAIEDGGAVQLDAATLLANDTDPDFIHGDVLNIVGVSQADSGAAVTLTNAKVQYDIGNLYQSLAQGQTATDTFSYTVSDLAGATSTATVAMTVAGANDGPVTADDAAAVQEDLNITATGNVLANDSDVDQGTVLSVADAGTQQGNYGQLTLNSDGSYSYTLDNASPAVQSLGRDAQVVEHFGYTATDGIVGAASVLDVFLNGANDAPILVVPLADQDLRSDKHFSWQMPAGSFTDIDQGDTLDYAATLADGSALPDWLSFDAATRTFSGEAPKKADLVDVQVTATDSVAATGSTAGSLSASDVFRISVSRGNEGVGNGEDAPPPGHDHNHNDGPGTSPGHPGSKGGNGYKADSDAHSHGQESGDRSSDNKANKGDTHAKDDEADDSHRTEKLIRAWFDEGSVNEQYLSLSDQDWEGGWGGQIDRQVNRNVAKGVSGDVSSEWERMNARLKKHLEQSGGDEDIFAESGTDSRPFGLFGSVDQQGIPQLGADNIQQLKALAGLREGLERLGQ
ncbi:MAG: Ig-like domain-containing protein, partial [Gallionella sp.]|nr:Ig-like domain-containing protein [Gallionella sp.]